ncbi:hypothetical protein DUNSADRAFT_1735 [Dunaliella salina]|uniref:Encoded protein n=1 Tax=Dunaliella salina TaxID=3046 RepID=A0ABQ7GWQ2_DUNSA|nr:hypothetical protein DUNSADRAFT_1735 [Dunaliella salina]|eukprot:KAF5839038.1 hypothetical protein DUNSADRAFT_1735 [Dunaliella salina]
MGCTVYKSSMCCFSLGLQDLSLLACKFKPGSLIDLGTLMQLRSLSLAAIFSQVIDMGCLTQLHNLHSLSIHKCSIIKLDTMLQNVPLRSLVLKGMDSVDIPSGINFASGTLRLMELNHLDLRNFQLMPPHLPSIQCVSITGIMLGGRSDELHRVHSAALALSKFPLSIPAARFHLSMKHGWSVEQQNTAIKALLPLGSILSLQVDALLLTHCILDQTCIHTLHSLFGSVHSLHILCDKHFFREGVLLGILQGMPSVFCISITMAGPSYDCKLPESRWWMTELLSVHQARRDLVLKLRARGAGFQHRDAFWEIVHAWQEAQRSLTGRSTIQLGICNEDV